MQESWWVNLGFALTTVRMERHDSNHKGEATAELMMGIYWTLLGNGLDAL